MICYLDFLLCNVTLNHITSLSYTKHSLSPTSVPSSFCCVEDFVSVKLWGAGKWPPANSRAQGVRSRLNKDTDTKCHTASTHPESIRKVVVGAN